MADRQLAATTPHTEGSPFAYAAATAGPPGEPDIAFAPAQADAPRPIAAATLYPLAGLLVAGAIGYGLGYLMTRR